MTGPLDDIVGYGTNGVVSAHQTVPGLVVKHVLPWIAVARWRGGAKLFKKFAKKVRTARLRVDSSKYPRIKFRYFGASFPAALVTVAAATLRVKLSIGPPRQEVRQLPCVNYRLACTAKPEVVANGKVVMERCGETLHAAMPLEHQDHAQLVLAMTTAALAALAANVAIPDLKPLNVCRGLPGIGAPEAWKVVDCEDLPASDDSEGADEATYRVRECSTAADAMAAALVITAVMASSPRDVAARMHQEFHWKNNTGTLAALRDNCPAHLAGVIGGGVDGLRAAQQWAAGAIEQGRVFDML